MKQITDLKTAPLFGDMDKIVNVLELDAKDLRDEIANLNKREVQIKETRDTAEAKLVKVLDALKTARERGKGEGYGADKPAGPGLGMKDNPGPGAAKAAAAEITKNLEDKRRAGLGTPRPKRESLRERAAKLDK